MWLDFLKTISDNKKHMIYNRILGCIYGYVIGDIIGLNEYDQANVEAEINNIITILTTLAKTDTTKNEKINTSYACFIGLMPDTENKVSKYYDNNDIPSCQMMALLIRSMLQNKYPSDVYLKNIYDVAKKYKPNMLDDDDEFMYHIFKYSSDLTLLKLSENDESQTYQYRNMSCFLFAYKMIRQNLINKADIYPYENVIYSVSEEGGRSNINAAITGAVMGCWYGYTSLPEKLLENIPNKQLLDKCISLFMNI